MMLSVIEISIQKKAHTMSYNVVYDVKRKMACTMSNTLMYARLRTDEQLGMSKLKKKKIGEMTQN